MKFLFSAASTLFQMRDRDRDLWCVGAGTFLSHSDEPISGLHSLSVQRLDALIYTTGKSNESTIRCKMALMILF